MVAQARRSSRPARTATSNSSISSAVGKRKLLMIDIEREILSLSRDGSTAEEILEIVREKFTRVKIHIKQVEGVLDRGLVHLRQTKTHRCECGILVTISPCLRCELRRMGYTDE